MSGTDSLDDANYPISMYICLHRVGYNIQLHVACSISQSDVPVDHLIDEVFQIYTLRYTFNIVSHFVPLYITIQLR